MIKTKVKDILNAWLNGWESNRIPPRVKTTTRNFEFTIAGVWETVFALGVAW